MNRREILAGASVVGLGSLAGCLSSVFGEEDVEFLGFRLINGSKDELVFDAQVRREGDQVYEVQSHTMAGREGNSVETYTSECDWGPSAQSFEIRCRESGGEWVTREILAEDHGGTTFHSIITYEMPWLAGWEIPLLIGDTRVFSEWFCEP